MAIQNQPAPVYSPTIQPAPLHVEIVQQQECDIIPVRDPETGLATMLQKRLPK